MLQDLKYNQVKGTAQDRKEGIKMYHYNPLKELREKALKSVK